MDIIEGMVGHGQVAAFVGPPRSHKTRAALAASVCVATGRPWFGHATAAGDVSFVALADNAQCVARKLQVAHPDAAHAHALRFCFNMDDFPLLQRLATPRLIVIDDWAAYCHAREVDIASAEQTRYAVDLFRFVANEPATKPAVLILASGHSLALEACADVVWRPNVTANGFLCPTVERR